VEQAQVRPTLRAPPGLCSCVNKPASNARTDAHHGVVAVGGTLTCPLLLTCKVCDALLARHMTSLGVLPTHEDPHVSNLCLSSQAALRAALAAAAKQAAREGEQAALRRHALWLRGREAVAREAERRADARDHVVGLIAAQAAREVPAWWLHVCWTRS